MSTFWIGDRGRARVHQLYPSRMTVDELAQSSGAQKFPEISHFYWTWGDLFCRVKGDVDRETPGHTRRRSWE